MRAIEVLFGRQCARLPSGSIGKGGGLGRLSVKVEILFITWKYILPLMDSALLFKIKGVFQIMAIFCSKHVASARIREGFSACPDEAVLAASLAGSGFARNLRECLPRAVFVVSFLPVRDFSTLLNMAQA
jgi:hypothetical protein